ncbi:MAG: DUF362 domain-containing protein [Bacteroidia bacterium]|nr:MAG: DUF362 domain-containing protein [Bacteroidia bacterium]
MILNRRSFIRTSGIAGTGLMLTPLRALDRQFIKAEPMIGVHPFIFENEDAVFIMKTDVDVKTNASAIKQAGLSFGRSVFGITDNPDNGVPLTHKVVIKPNLTCRGKWNPDYTVVRSMGVVTDANFTEGVIESLKELEISASQIYAREVNCPEDLAEGGYTDMAERTGIDMKGIDTPYSDLNPDQLQWMDVEDGIYFKKIPYLWPVNAPESWLLNIAKLKTHSMGMTLCAKNIQGTIAMNYQQHCKVYGSHLNIRAEDIQTNAFASIQNNYNRHVADGIPRWDRPGQEGGIWMETWASRCLDNNSVTSARLHVIEGGYGRDGDFIDGPNEGGLAKDYMTNVIIFGLNPFYVDIVGHWIGGHEPGNFGLFHMAKESGMISTIDPANIPVYEWDAASGANLKALDEFQRHTLKTGYLRKDYDGAIEEYWHMVDEYFDYSTVSIPAIQAIAFPFKLGGNFPNPFSENTHIPFQLQKAGHVSLEVINAQGRTVDILVNRQMIPGNHMITWNSSHHPAGLYLCRMRFGGMLQSGNMLVVH